MTPLIAVPKKRVQTNEYLDDLGRVKEQMATLQTGPVGLQQLYELAFNDQYRVTDSGEQHSSI